MSNWRERYLRWMNAVNLDRDTRNQLERLPEHILEDCFDKQLEFGTGGLRGELGPGPNRMNIYTVRKATEGLARYLSEHGNHAKRRGIVIAYDSRHQSAEFALEAAKVIGKHGIRVFLFDRLCPTPLLSFAVRYLGAFAGIVITASHNPPEYNGYKVYGEDGGQITPTVAEQLMAKINEVEDELTVSVMEEAELRQNGLLTLIHDDIQAAYVTRLQSIRMPVSPVAAASKLKIVFSPLHGTSSELMLRVLKQFGYNQITVVREQAYPDPRFPNAGSLNPEEYQAFTMAIQYGKQIDADLLMVTDPDADRVGLAVKDGRGEYIVLTGNQVGALMLHHLLSAKQKAGILPANGVVLKTIVTSEIARAIAADFGLETVDTLTGFKYIGEKMTEYEKTGEYSFQFGFEESSGYVIGDFVRDKDGIQAALMAADMCACYQAQGQTLYEGLLHLYARYGFYSEDLHSITLKGKTGAGKMAAIMEQFRQQSFTEFAGKKVTVIEDYLSGTCRDIRHQVVSTISLPTSDVLKYRLEDESWFCLRPSGTEPKLKLYLGVKGVSQEDSKEKLAQLKESVLSIINALTLD